MRRRLLIAICVAALVSLSLLLFFINRSNQARAARQEASGASYESAGASSASRAIDDIALIGDAFTGGFSPVDSDAEPRTVKLKNSVFTITLDAKGACVSSVRLNAFEDKGEPLEMTYSAIGKPSAFMLYRGSDITNPIDDLFEIEAVTADSVTFRRDFLIGGKKVALRKEFTISEQYMVRLRISFTAVSQSDGQDVVELPTDAYTLEFAPFLGPAPGTQAASASRRSRASQDDRNFYIKKDRKRRGINFAGSARNVFVYKDDFDWFEWTGKYFSLIAIPEDKSIFDLAVYKRGEYDNSIYLIRSQAKGDETSGISDDIYFYIGPQLKDFLQLFDYREDNSFGLHDLSLDKAIEGGGALPWLQNVLKAVMKVFYHWIPNWGVAIILLTLLIKVILYPLNARSARSSAAMQKIAPKLEQIRKEYQDDPQAQNQAIMALYKKNGINPLSSLLPMIIQLPILFAVYGLLNKHFELRGAMFIPGWIEDLSMPETVCALPFSIPLLGNQLHALPIIYGLSMVLSMIWTQRQNTAAQSGGMQKFMTYGLPIILFFSLYNISSGLLVYWTDMNFLSILQQLFENKRVRRSEDVGRSAGAEGSLRILPPKAKKKDGRK